MIFEVLQVIEIQKTPIQAPDLNVNPGVMATTLSPATQALVTNEQKLEEHIEVLFPTSNKNASIRNQTQTMRTLQNLLRRWSARGEKMTPRQVKQKPAALLQPNSLLVLLVGALAHARQHS